MLKLIYPEANEQLLTQCEGLMTNVIFNDSSNKLVKEASSNSITRDLLNSYKPDKDHFMIHFIGVGDYEKYGFNFMGIMKDMDNEDSRVYIKTL